MLQVVLVRHKARKELARESFYRVLLFYGFWIFCKQYFDWFMDL